MKVKKVLCISVLLFSFCCSLIYVKADSGWDSSYDSGGWDSGGWDYDSSWSGGSSWDNDYSWNSGSSGNYSSGDGESFISFFMIMILIIIFIIYFTNRNRPNSNNSDNETSNNYSDIDISKISNIDPTLNLSEFKIRAFNIYKNIQEAWMEFDNDAIRELTTDELYNMYASQLETLKLKKQKNIMSNITSEKINILNVRLDEINKVVNIDVYLRVCCYDYVINENTKEVVRGTKNKKLIIEYIITFVKSCDNKEVEKCPNCGAPIKMNSSKICPYCDSTLVKVSSKYVMSKKKCIGQTFDRR